MRRWVVVIVATASLASACGSEGSAIGEVGSTETGSPIAELLGQSSFNYGVDGGSDRAQALAEEIARQEEIQSCMERQGFEYFLPSVDTFTFSTSDGGLAYG